jgi:hypothetical protein
VDTDTSTASTEVGDPPAGETAVKVVASVTVTEVAGVDPNSTVDPEVNPDPVTVTVVPPAARPSEGLIPETVGTGS